MYLSCKRYNRIILERNICFNIVYVYRCHIEQTNKRTNEQIIFILRIVLIFIIFFAVRV